MAADTFKKKATVLKLIDERRLSVRIDGEEVIATISSRVKSGEQELDVGDVIIVVTNPYHPDSVRVHKATWKNFPPRSS